MPMENEGCAWISPILTKRAQKTASYYLKLINWSIQQLVIACLTLWMRSLDTIKSRCSSKMNNTQSFLLTRICSLTGLCCLASRMPAQYTGEW